MPEHALTKTESVKARTKKRRPTWLIISVLCLSGTVVSLQQTLMVPLLPDFPKILHVDSVSVAWLVTVTLLTAAVGTPIVTKLADMFGKRRMLLIAMVTMILGSIVCAVGGTFPMLIVGRALQGLATSMIPVGISIMRDELPKERVAGAVALMSATLGIGSALGLPLSGIIYQGLGWEAIFWLSTAAGVILLIAAVLVVPESELRTKGRFDVVGAFLLSGALVCLLLAISKGGDWGWTSEPVILLFIAAVVLLAAFVPFELRVGQPMVDLRTSAKRPVLLTNVASLLVGFSMYANMMVTTQLLQLPTFTGFGFGLVITVAGLCMVPSGLMMVVFAPISAKLTTKFGAKTTLITGGAILAVAYIGRVFLTGEVWMVILGATLVSVGTAIAYAAMPTLIMRSVPITETASANGLNSLLRSVGTSTASAAIAAILSSIVASHQTPAGAVSTPTLSAFTTVFWMASIAALASIGVSVFIPSAKRFEPATSSIPMVRPEHTGPATASIPVVRPSDSEDEELVVRGVVVGTDGKPVRNGVVTALSLEGQAADWSRADHEGKFNLVLPYPGSFLVVCSADGWAPTSQVVEFSANEAQRLLQLQQRLELAGYVRAGEVPLPGALVTMVRSSGEYLTYQVTDDDGRYAMPLPAPGRYILSALAAGANTAMTRQVNINGQALSVDFQAQTGQSLVGAASTGSMPSVGAGIPGTENTGSLN